MPDTVNAVLEYPEGFTVNLSSTFNNQSASESGFEILGTEAALVLRDGPMLLKPENVVEGNGWVVSSWPEALEKAYYDDPKVKALERPEHLGAADAQGQRGVRGGRAATRPTSTWPASSTRCAAGGQPVQDGVMGHRAAAAAHMVNLSLRQGRPLEWNGEGPKAT